MPGRLNLTIVPRGTIYVDQKLFGENTDRFESDLLAGTHYLNIVALDAASVFWADSMRLKPAEEFKKRLDFNQQFDVRIVAVDAAHEPLAGARISVDGVWRKHTTPANFKLRFGHHALMVQMEGCEILQPAWQSNLESKTKIEFRLKRAQ